MLHINVTITGGPEDKKRELTNSVNSGMKAAIKRDYWKGFLEEHFKPSAVRKYGYQPRTKKYQLAKARKKHHQNPLVWSGSLKRELTRSITLRVAKRVSEASGKLAGRALRLSGRETMPDMKAEVIATTANERRQMAATTRKVATKLQNSVRRQKTIKVC